MRGGGESDLWVVQGQLGIIESKQVNQDASIEGGNRTHINKVTSCRWAFITVPAPIVWRVSKKAAPKTDGQSCSLLSLCL